MRPFAYERAADIGQATRLGALTGQGQIDAVVQFLAGGTSLIDLMKLDVLSGFEKIDVCTAYELDGQRMTEYPVSPGDLARCKPVYETLSGWKEDLTVAKSLKDLPRYAQEYIQFIGAGVAVPIDVVSVGPGRDQTLWIKPLFS